MSFLINATTMNAFPVASSLFKTIRSSKSKAAMAAAKPTVSTASSPSTDWFGIISLALCFMAALVINITFLYGLLQMLAPRLPLACLSIYGAGYGVMLFVGRLEQQEEELWIKAQMNAKVEKPVVIEGIEEDF